MMRAHVMTTMSRDDFDVHDHNDDADAFASECVCAYMEGREHINRIIIEPK